VSVAAVGCDEPLAPQYQQHPGGGTGGGAGTDSNPGSSGTSAVPNGGSDPTSSAGSGGGAATAGSSGTGGASVGGAGGAGGTGGGTDSGGSSGTSGTAGSGGSPIADPCAHTGPQTKTDLTPTNGRVECATNDFGIEGDWKINSADPALITSAFTGSMVCANGTIAQVVATTTSGGEPDFGRYWGGGIALIMHNEGAGFLAQPYNATANGLTGISVKITAGAKPIPAQMRFKFKMTTSNESYCIEVDGATSGQTVTLHTRDAKHNCWMPDTTSTLDPTTIENYEVQVVSQTSMAVPFDFCLSEITALTD